MTYIQSEIVSLLRQGYDNVLEISKLVKCTPDWVRKTKRLYQDHIDAPAGMESSDRRYKLAAQLQKSRDVLRVERKQFREEIRFHNALNELSEELIMALQEHRDFDTVIHDENYEVETEGLLQISDIHFNELIDMPYNKCDFRIAAKRLKKYVTRAKKMFLAHDVNTVHVCFSAPKIKIEFCPGLQKFLIQ